MKQCQIVYLIAFGLLPAITLNAGAAQISTLNELIRTLNESGTNAKLGFLSGANYISVKRILTKNVIPVYYQHKKNMMQSVLNGSIVAGLMTSLPDRQWYLRFNIFGSTVVSLHAILMAPDNSSAYPQGVPEDLSSYHLSIAVNAAIERFHALGIDKRVAEKNLPMEIVNAHTCKDHDLNMFPLPNRRDAKGLLRHALDWKILHVLASGPHDCGSNVGNYNAYPPVGLYQDLLEAIVVQMANLSGPDKEPYDPLLIVRQYFNVGCFPWTHLFDGTAHITESYFIYDGAYGGSCKPCNSDEDCPNAVDLPVRKESCFGSFCHGPLRQIVTSFRPACTVHGTEAKFITKKEATF